MRERAFCRAELPLSGLGNRLFSWARCIIFSRRYGIPKIDSFFPQLSIGNYLRGDTSNRFYANLFKFRQGGVSVWKYPYLKSVLPEVGEPEDIERFDPNKAEGKIIVFRGTGNYFGPLNAHQAFITEELRRITRNKWLEKANSSPTICIHVRLGDFRVAKDQSEFITTGGLRTPLTWYKEVLLQVRAAMGRSLDAVVMSNGGPKDLQELLSLPNVFYFDDQNPMVSLFTMANSKLILGAGGSTFSAWGSYLGRVPTLVVPGQTLTYFKIDLPGVVNSEYDPVANNQEFLAQLLEPSKLSRVG